MSYISTFALEGLEAALWTTARTTTRCTPAIVALTNCKIAATASLDRIYIEYALSPSKGLHAPREGGVVWVLCERENGLETAPLKAAANKVAEALDADVYAYFGDLVTPPDNKVIRELRSRRRRKNLMLLLATYGGQGDFTYRLCRALQQCYNVHSDDEKIQGSITIFIPALCKSAGTLLALGADALVLGDDAELGPLDAQLSKPEEVGERISGLTPREALGNLQAHATRMFDGLFNSLRFGPSLGFPTKASVEIASTITVGLLSPVYAQIDPMRIAEIERLTRIAGEYGERLMRPNVKEGTLAKLLAWYPSHEFVIDREEASTLFHRVDRPSEELRELAAVARDGIEKYIFNDVPYAGFLSDEASKPIMSVVDETSKSGNGVERKET